MPSLPSWDTCTQSIGGEQIATVQCLEVIFARILVIIVSLAALAVFVMFIMGGFKLLTSGGDPKTTASARQTLTYAIIGIALMSVAYIIFWLLGQITGIPNLLQFRLPPANSPTP